MTHEPPIAPEIRACRLCAEDFARTETMHEPRPVVWLSTRARILIAGQAPGLRVHESGLPFDDRSGDRLREWLGVSREEFYNRDLFSIMPMAFCFPGYDAKGADLPPPKRCARTWRDRTLAEMPRMALTLLIGGYAQKWHFGKRAGTVTDTVSRFREFAPDYIPLPHPSWRNTGWLKKNPWFTRDLLPDLRQRVAELTREAP